MFKHDNTDTPMFAVSTTDLTAWETSAFPTLFPPAHLARMQSLEPLAVASCPATPIKRRASFLQLLNKLNPGSRRRNGTHSTAPRVTHPSPPQRRGTHTAGRIQPRKRLSIRDPAFFFPSRTQAVNVYDDEENTFCCDNAEEREEDGNKDHKIIEVAVWSGLHAPPPTPHDPMGTLPQTDVREALCAIENSAGGSPRRKKLMKRMKIVQMLGPEAAGAAKRHVG
ncbi:hypothetical protein C8R44DRAFT_725138 [Mycena epipterygia]|nr:hypothetical protein C8R44DRAFT_725138 [Mycena epipterygia]